MKTFLITIIILMTFGTEVSGQSVDDIVDSISDINEVHFELVGIAGRKKSHIYKKFIQLEKKADIDKLVELTEHKSTAVACYASWALVDKNYSKLPEIFENHLDNKRRVTIYSGDRGRIKTIARFFYERILNKAENKKTNNTLIALDSIVLYQENPPKFLFSEALKNRLYPKSYHQRIENLAFEQDSIEAVLYLSNWHKAKYHDKIKNSLIGYLQEVSFNNALIRNYHRVVIELLEFNDENVKELVSRKFRNDNGWETEEEVFRFLLRQNEIYYLNSDK